MSGKKVTVRKQKIKKNHIREKLIFFTVLTLILLIVAAIARKLCPYDPYAQNLLLAQKDSPYLMAVKMSGSSVPKILFKHILPNIAGQILVTAVLDIGTMMMELAGLSFLGLGVQPPAAEWGSMINDGRSMLQISPWMVLAPGVAIFITVMIFNLLGDTLRDYMDPKQREKNKREEKNK